MARKGYKVITVSEKHEKRAKKLKAPMKEKSVAGVVETLIDEKHSTIFPKNDEVMSDGSEPERQ